MVPLSTQIDDACSFLCAGGPLSPRVGMILGTGLGGFAAEIEDQRCWPYEEIPHFPISTALGHRGQLCSGSVHGVPLITMEGRFHLYEGYSPLQITLPIRVMHRLGIELLIVSNASGGLHPLLQVGDIVLIEDHINCTFTNPLMQGDQPINEPAVDVRRPYDAELIQSGLATARRHGFRASSGTYVAVTGPNYETRAEYRYNRKLGGDVIGMSTVPEVIVAAQLGLKVLAISTVTNVCRPDCLGRTDGQSVASAAQSSEDKLRLIVKDALRAFAT
jgi:purine-nucleoside phosphorylase